MTLAKIAIEEAFHNPRDVRPLLSDPELLQQFSDRAGLTPAFYRPVLERLGEFDEIRLGEMDRGGISHAILSFTAPGIQSIIDPRRARDEAKRQNDFLAETIARHPDRYSGFAAVALQDPTAAIAELRRCVGELGFKGVLVNGYTNVDAESAAYLDEPQFDDFWSALVELDVPLYLHPRPALPSWQRGAIHGHPELFGATWGFGLETSTHVLRLIFSGLFDRHPGIKLIVGHLGEGLPAQLWRTQYNFDKNPFDKKIEKTLPDYFADNIWLTTSGNFSSQALDAAIGTVGADHIMFAVDYPYADTQLGTDWIESAPISEIDRRKIAHGNATSLFGIGQE
ncbi:amidohydrolase family protein [Nocardia arthritidis]|nr:amidohydrolase family protein [Nocardia arthritidis]